eukprot:m.33703 g.33703  ORF g.33703 m.33703 type:complete len:259 (+) comp12587_c0_seq1:67-843(+)
MEPPGARDSVPDAPPGWNDADSGGLLSEEMTREIGAKVTREIGQNIATNALQVGTAKAKSFFDTYARVDLLRPYFDHTPTEIRTRLLRSLWPRTFPEESTIVDMYGPVMLNFTLAAVLLVLMKTSVHGKQISTGVEETLMGTALAVSFGYWITFSAMLYTVGFIFNTDLTGLQMLTLTGYGLFSYCLCLAPGVVQSLTGDRELFTVLWAVVGTLSAAKIGIVMREKTTDKKQGSIVGLVAFAIHWLWLLRLHRGYTHK